MLTFIARHHSRHRRRHTIASPLHFPPISHRQPLQRRRRSVRPPLNRHSKLCQPLYSHGRRFVSWTNIQPEAGPKWKWTHILRQWQNWSIFPRRTTYLLKGRIHKSVLTRLLPRDRLVVVLSVNFELSGLQTFGKLFAWNEWLYVEDKM